MSGEQDLFLFLLIALIVWNSCLSVYLYNTISKYKKLTRGTNNQNLEQIVTKLIEKQEVGATNLAKLSQSLIEFQKKSSVFFQKVGVLRFNPFEDSGGDQSFTIAMLDGTESGFIISSLHSRSGTRVYAKEVKNGKSAAHSLTKEEKEALDKALRRK